MSVILVKLLCEVAICADILCNDSNIPISILGDGVSDALEGGRVAGVGSGRDGRDEVLEEREGDVRYGDRPLLLPDINGIVELLCRRKRSEVPGVAIVVDIFDVSSNGDS